MLCDLHCSRVGWGEGGIKAYLHLRLLVSMCCHRIVIRQDSFCSGKEVSRENQWANHTLLGVNLLASLPSHSAELSLL